MMPTVFAEPSLAATDLELATLIVALLLLGALIHKEIGDHFADGPMRRVSLALRAVALPLALIFLINAGLMVLASLR